MLVSALKYQSYVGPKWTNSTYAVPHLLLRMQLANTDGSGLVAGEQHAGEAGHGPS